MTWIDDAKKQAKLEKYNGITEFLEEFSSTIEELNRIFTEAKKQGLLVSDGDYDGRMYDETSKRGGLMVWSIKEPSRDRTLYIKLKKGMEKRPYLTTQEFGNEKDLVLSEVEIKIKMWLKRLFA